MEKGPEGFGITARMLHWLVAVAVLLMIPAGLIMVRDGLPRAIQDALFLFHKNLGTLLIPVILFRIYLRSRHSAPPLPDHMPLWQRRVAAASHLLLYALLVVMPISGYIRVRAGGFPIEALDRLNLPQLIPNSKAVAGFASQLHEVSGYALMALLAVHIGAAMYHAMIRGDGIWERMWPPHRRG